MNAHVRVSQYVSVQGAQFPTCLPKVACLFGVALRVANDAGFHMIKLLTEPLGFFCLKGLEDQGVLQGDTREGMLPFPTISCSQSYRFLLLPLLHWGGRVQEGMLSLGSADQSLCSLRSFQFKVIWASQSLPKNWGSFWSPHTVQSSRDFPACPNACRRSCQAAQMSFFSVWWWVAELSVRDMMQWPLQWSADGCRAETGKLPAL